jgi:hypothetical protein
MQNKIDKDILPKFILLDSNSNPLSLDKVELGFDIKQIDIQYKESNELNDKFLESLKSLKKLDNLYVTPTEHTINITDDSSLRFTSANGINFLQTRSAKNILRISPYFSPINLLEVQRHAVNIGDIGDINSVDLNLVNGSIMVNGSIFINGKQVLGQQLDAISDDLPLEEKVNSILKVLRKHGLINV